jgi:hypothetical protein
MIKGNLNGVEVSIDRSCGREKGRRDASITSARWVPQRLSHEILRDLGMSEDEIAQYFRRFRQLITDTQQPPDTFLPGRYHVGSIVRSRKPRPREKVSAFAVSEAKHP